MATLELKNNLLRMVAATDDPLILEQITALLTSLREEADWWDQISDAEKKKIEEGMRQSAARQTVPHEVVRAEVNRLLGKN